MCTDWKLAKAKKNTLDGDPGIRIVFPIGYNTCLYIPNFKGSFQTPFGDGTLHLGMKSIFHQYEVMLHF